MKYRPRRKPTDFSVFLLVGEDRVSLDVLNVSEKGMRVRQNGVLLIPDDEVFVEIRSRRYPSRVTWSREREAGLEFDQHLPPDFMAMVAPMKASAKKRRYLPEN
ncbi:MAG: PilZ domain-containing protein [Pseudomonadota bacterium]